MPARRTYYQRPNYDKEIENYHSYVTVDKNAYGDFTKIQSAIDDITDASEENKYVIYIIGSGIYEEDILLDKPHICLVANNLSSILIKGDMSISLNNEIHCRLSVSGKTIVQNSNLQFKSCNLKSTTNDCLELIGSRVILSDVLVDTLLYGVLISSSSELTYLNGQVSSGSSFKDFVIDNTSTLNLGSVNCSHSKIQNNGVLNLIPTCELINFNNEIIKLPNEPTNLHAAIYELSKNSFKSQMILGENIQEMKVIYKASDGKIYKASNDNSENSTVCGILLESGLINEEKTVLHSGIIKSDSFSFNAEDKKLFLSTNGGVTTQIVSIPDTYIVEVGKIISSNSFLFYVSDRKVKL